MSNTKHTPGPWDIYNKDEVRAGGRIIAHCMPQGEMMERAMDYSFEEDASNARLIAAAPSMLDVLLRAQHYQEHAAIKKMIVDVIELATGEKP